mmetsp:Transcript_91421/g.181748  ORF Transcript_91421/g.181748 Transcript_91421/m.181748 type:complete len:188 (+) Transcript_91421:627-1190(+)
MGMIATVKIIHGRAWRITTSAGILMVEKPSGAIHRTPQSSGSIVVYHHPHHWLMRATTMLTVVGMMFKDVDDAMTIAVGWATRAPGVTRATWTEKIHGGAVDLLGLIQHIQGRVTSKHGTMPNAMGLAMWRHLRSAEKICRTCEQAWVVQNARVQCDCVYHNQLLLHFAPVRLHSAKEHSYRVSCLS